MRIQFHDKRHAARFAAAVVNVTGRKPILSRTESSRWRVQLPGLSGEWALAIHSLLEMGVSAQRMTLEQVARWVQTQRWAPLGA